MLKRIVCSAALLICLAAEAAATEDACPAERSSGSVPLRPQLAQLAADTVRVASPERGDQVRLSQLSKKPAPKVAAQRCLNDKNTTYTATCNADSTVTLTLTTTTPSSFAGTHISLYPITTGATVQPSPQQLLPSNQTTSWTISGASGPTMFAVNVSRTGGGSIAGTDACCLGLVTVDLPSCAKTKMPPIPPVAPPFTPPPTGVACTPPFIKNAVGACACPAGLVPRGQTCVRPPLCNRPFVLNAAGTGCECEPGTTLRGKTCVRVPECKKPFVLDAKRNVCACPAGKKQRGNECVGPEDCRPPMVFNKRTFACTCPSGTVPKGDECVKQVVCRRPFVLNKTRDACECQEGTILRGQTCVPAPSKDRGEPKGR